MKQLKNIDFKNLTQNIIYPIFEEQAINNDLLTTFSNSLEAIVDKTYNSTTVIHTLGKYNFETITFLGLGKSSDLTSKKIRELANNISLSKAAILYLNDFNSDVFDIHQLTKTFIESYIIGSYQEQIIGHEEKEITDLDILFDHFDLSEDINMAKIYAEGINYARKISDTPANLMNPNDLVNEAKKLADKYGMECTILDKQELEKIGAGGILAVNQGSKIPAYIICLKYNNNGNEPYTAVIGKGLTFDSGGYNIKSNSYGMKYDMCGGADILGIMKILAASKAKTNVYGIIPTTENLISDKAYRPQDVITTLSKKTVEIVSTDAEGRLILCDAITYAQQLGAKKIIDLATLTGACVSALGDIYTGVFSNDDCYYHQFKKIMIASDEKGWRLPLDQEYFKKLKSTSADLKNSAGKPGAGASIAACFLEAFIEDDTKWLHLDIAGTADNDGTKATGAMIRSVVNMVKN